MHEMIRNCAISFMLGLGIGLLTSDNTTIEHVYHTNDISVVTTTCVPTEAITTYATTSTTTTVPVVTSTTTTVTTTETKPVTTSTSTTTTVKETKTTPVTTVTEPTVTEVVDIPAEEGFIGTFSRGTFYTTGSVGGSGRSLVSGYSIASRALYEKYGYGNYKIRIECDAYPELNGIYSLDDCSAPGNYEVIDFWFAPGCVPGYFRKMGVFEVRAYIVY